MRPDAEATVINMEILRIVAPAFRVRMVLGLLSPGESLMDDYQDALNWERERTDKTNDESEVQRRD
jgi:hypothetical protein